MSFCRYKPTIASILGCALCAPQFLLGSSTLALANDKSPQSISFVFSVIAPQGEQIANVPQASEGDDTSESNSDSFGSLEDGAVINSQDLLRLEQNANKRAEEPKVENLYKNSFLVGEYRNISTGELLSKTLAECTKLNFETDSRALFEDRVNCDGVTYGYDTSGEGINVIANGVVHSTIELDKGVYVLNGIPFSVQ